MTEDGKLMFDGGEDLEGPFDLIIGAEGAWSRVRGRLNSVGPVYSGVSGYELNIPEPAKTCPHVDKTVGRGGFFGSSDPKCLNAQRMADDSLKVRSWYPCPEGEAQAMIDKNGKRATLEQILNRYPDWAPEITEFLKQADLNTLKVWTCYELPVGYKWDHKQGYTLIGDAASLSAPFSGEGVNKAMKDSLELAELIERSQAPNADLTLDQAVQRYEELEFPGAERLQSVTRNFKQLLFEENAPIGLFPGLLKTMANDSPSVFMKIAGSAPVLGIIYGYFWIIHQVGWAVRRFWRRT